MRPKPKTGQYYYTPCGSSFRIYRYDHVSGHGGSASPVSEEPVFYNREDARKRVYELNGWKYGNK